MSIKSRACQPCTACCDGWVQMVIEGNPVYPGSPCQHSSCKGCAIYESRPVDPCDNFNCGWLIEDSPLPMWMKPNKSKVIVIFNKTDWNGLPVDLAMPVGRKIPSKSLKWLMNFAEENMRPLIYTEQIIENGTFSKQQQMTGYGPPEFQHDVVQWRKEGRKLW